MGFTPEDESVTAALTQEIGHPAPFSTNELRKVEELFATQVKRTRDFSALVNLKGLYLQNCALSNLEDIADLRALEYLEVSSSRLVRLDALSDLPRLMVCDFRKNLIEDIRQLLSLESLSKVILWGNPLSQHSIETVVPELKNRGVNVLTPDRVALRLSHVLRDKGIEASYRKSGDYYEFSCLTPDFIRNIEDDEYRFAVIDPDTLRAELDAGVESCEALFERYETDFETLRRQQTRERTTGAELEAWIDEVELPSSTAEALRAYGARFPDQTFVREEMSLLKRWGKSRGPVWDLGLRRFPDWYVQVRRAVGWPEVDGEPAMVEVDTPVDGLPDGAAVALAPAGAATKGLRTALVDRHHIIPIGWAGGDAGWALAIELEEDIRKVYAFRAEEAFDWEFDPRSHVAFESFADLFASVAHIRSAEEVSDALAGLDEEPPEIDVDVEAHLERGGADDARAWVVDAELPDELAESLTRFIDGFSDETFVRETDELLDYYEVVNDAQLPDWYREVRRTLAYVELDGRPTSLVFGDWDGWESHRFLMGPAKVNSDVGRMLMREHELFPFGSERYHVLVVPMSENAGREVSWCATDELGRDDFRAVRAFDSLAEMFDAVTGVARGEEVIERSK